MNEIDDLRNAEDYSSVQRRRASKSAVMEGVGKVRQIFMTHVINANYFFIVCLFCMFTRQ